MANNNTIKVSDAIRSQVEAEARAVCTAAKVSTDSFNQALCAVTAFRLLKKVKGEAEQLQVLYVCANASALRQALEKAPEGGSAIADGLMGLIK